MNMETTDEEPPIPSSTPRQRIILVDVKPIIILDQAGTGYQTPVHFSASETGDSQANCKNIACNIPLTINVED